MDAKDFVKKHGWTAVIAAVKNTTAEETAAFESKELKYLDDNNPMLGVNIKVYAIPYNDVKTLVDAYELVQSYGGVDYLRFALEHSDICGTDELEQAIQLVESVDEND